MKKIFIFLLLVCMFTGCGNSVDIEKNEVDSMLENMTLEEKIGQMLIVYYNSSKMDDTLKKSLLTVKPGGFILFGENITTYNDTLNFIKEIKSTSDIPMFISIDQEGGNVQRLLSLKDKEVSNIPYMYYVGLKDDESLAYDVGKVVGEELRVFGINMDFAPDIDVYTNEENTVIGKRSFGNDASLVSRLGTSFARGLESTGVIAVYKHFPGHGNTSVDSHYSLPVVEKSKKELLSLELVPFREAIKNNASAIMVGHIAVPSITGDNTPSTLSKEITTNLLKGELGFNGLVITDALNMGALTSNYTKEEIYVRSILAGCDILLMPGPSKDAVAYIKKAVQSGRISIDVIDESVRKILTLKYEKINDSYNDYLDSSYLNSEEHEKVLDKIKGSSKFNVE